MIYDICIAGAGAAGLAAVCGAVKINENLKIAVLEKNASAGKKLLATGNGKCNFSNINAAAKSYMSAGVYDESDKLAPAVFAGSGVDFLKELGLRSYSDEAGRLYPRSNQAADVLKALKRGAEGGKNTEFIYNFEIKSAVKNGDVFEITSAGGQIIKAKKLIICCGGKAGIQFGSDGKGFKLAESFGHSVIKPIPALSPVIPAEDISELSGVRAQADVSLIKCGADGEAPVSNPVYGEKERGEVQFAKDYISGICVMDQSRCLRLEEGVSYKLKLDFSCGKAEEASPEFFKRPGLSENESALVLTESLCPEKLGVFLLKKAGINSDSKLKTVSAKALEKLASVWTGLEFTITGTKGWKEAQLTSGGVRQDEIKPESLESKLIPGLYFAGEVIDIEGVCGGYNLNWAFSSAYLAGKRAAAE